MYVYIYSILVFYVAWTAFLRVMAMKEEWHTYCVISTLHTLFDILG